MTFVEYTDKILNNLFETTSKWVNQHNSKPLTVPQYLANISNAVEDVINNLNVKLTPNNRNQVATIFGRYMVTFWLLDFSLLRQPNKPKELKTLITKINVTQTCTYLTPIIVSQIFDAVLVGNDLLTNTSKPGPKGKEFLDSLSKDVRDLLLRKDFDKEDLIKLVIFRLIYNVNDKWELKKIFEETTQDSDEYVYIDVVLPPEKTKQDSTFLKLCTASHNDIQAYADMLSELNAVKHTTDFMKALDFLFLKGLAIPVTDDFSRFHVNKDLLPTKGTNTDDHETIRVNSLINKVTAARDIKLADENELWLKDKKGLRMLPFNHLQEVKIVNKMYDSPSSGLRQNLHLYQELRSYLLRHYFDATSNEELHYVAKHPMTCIRIISLNNPDTGYDLRNIITNEEITLAGIVLTSNSYHLLQALNNGEKPTILPFKKLDGELQSIFYPSSPSYYLQIKADDTNDVIHELIRISKQVSSELALESANEFHTPSKRLMAFRQICGDKNEINKLFWLYGAQLLNLSKTIIKLPTDPGHIKRRRSLKLVQRCAHSLLSSRKDRLTAMTQLVQRYAVPSEDDTPVCRSCGENIQGLMTQLGKAELDDESGEYIVTQIANPGELKYSRDFLNLQTLIDDLDNILHQRVARMFHLHALIGTDIKPSSLRTSIVRDTLQLFSHHTVLQDGVNEDQRTEMLGSSVGSTLIKTNVFLTDTLIRDRRNNQEQYNLLIIYLLVVILLYCGETEIVTLSQHVPSKMCGLPSFNKNSKFFKDLYLPPKSSINTMPIFCYLLFTGSCLINYYGLFVSQENQKEDIIKQLVVTSIDILGSTIVCQDNTQIHKLIGNRFMAKRKPVFENTRVMQRIEGTQNNVKPEKDSKLKWKLGQNKRWMYNLVAKRYRSVTTSKYTSGRFVTNSNQKITYIKKPDLIRRLQKEHRDLVFTVLPSSYKRPAIEKVPCKVNREKVSSELKQLGKLFPATSIFHEDTLTITHNYQGLVASKYQVTVPLSTLQKDTVSTENKSKVPALLFTVPNKKIKMVFHASHLYFIGYFTNKNTFYKYKGQSLYAIKNDSLKTRLESISRNDDETFEPSEVSIIKELLRRRPDLGEVDIKSFLLNPKNNPHNISKTDITLSTEMARKNELSESLQMLHDSITRICASLGITKTTERQTNSHCGLVLNIIEYTSTSLSRKTHSIEEVEEIINKHLPSNTQTNLLSDLMLRSKTLSSALNINTSTTTPGEVNDADNNEDQDNEETPGLEEMTNDLDVDGEIYDTEE